MTYSRLRLQHRRITVLMGGLLLLFAQGLAHADVYKWADRDGRIHYTDRPPPAEGRLISIAQTGRSVTLNAVESTEGAAPAAAHPPSPTPAPLPPADAAALNRLKAGVAADVAAHDAAACQSAEERYRQYVGARHLYRTGERGERVYLTDAEIESARVQARREVEEFCGHSP